MTLKAKLLVSMTRPWKYLQTLTLLVIGVIYPYSSHHFSCILWILASNFNYIFSASNFITYFHLILFQLSISTSILNFKFQLHTSTLNFNNIFKFQLPYFKFKFLKLQVFSTSNFKFLQPQFSSTSNFFKSKFFNFKIL